MNGKSRRKSAKSGKNLGSGKNKERKETAEVPTETPATQTSLVQQQKEPESVSDNPMLNALARYRVVLLSMAVGAILTNVNDVVQAGIQLVEFVDGLRGTRIPKADILVAPLRGQTTQFNVDFQRRIVTRINEESRLAERPLTVKTLSAPLESEEDAREVLAKGQASVVLWGWQDDVGVRLQVTTEVLPERSEAGEIPFYSIPTTDKALHVNSAVDSAAMLSCLAVAHHLFKQNQHSLGRAYLERALSMLPNSKDFVKNPALNYYLIANRVAPEDYESVRFRIEYFAKSVAEDPTFVPSLNNLAKALGSESDGYNDVGYFQLLGEDAADDIVVLAFSKVLQVDKPEVLKRMNSEDPSLLLWDHAIKLAPKLAILKYNRIAHRWLPSHSASAEFEAECQIELSDIVKEDSSISGVHAMLGVIAARSGDYNRAKEHFEAASKLNPLDAHLAFNLGQVKRRSDANAAVAEYTKALRLDPNHHASRMGRALYFASRREWENALTEISVVPAHGSGSDPAADGAPLLKWIIAACAGNNSAMADAHEKVAMKRDWVFETQLFRHWLSKSSKSLSEAGIDGERPFNFNDTRNGTGYHELNFYDALSFRVAEAEEGQGEELENYPTRAQVDATVAQRAKEKNLSIPEYLLARFSEVFSAHLEYRKLVVIGGLACPYVLGWDEDEERWVVVSTVLTHREGKGARGEDVLDLARQFKKFLIYEAEPEISYFDRLYVTQGDVILLDRKNEVLHPGESVPFSVHSAGSPEPVILHADGFYQPLRSSRHAEIK